ncbi:MAG: Calx-beta domain-containing protein, partial [Gammaproteobacteria bacterium]
MVCMLPPASWLYRLAFLTTIIIGFYHSISHADIIAGDLAPYGTPDGILNSADVLILQRIVMGNITPTANELLAGDVAPLNNPDGQLDAGDLVVLQRAVFGLVSLPPVSGANNPPVLNTGTSPTNNNPYPVTGTATPDAEVRLYVNNLLQTSTLAAADGSFSFNAILLDGSNNLYTTLFSNNTESTPSNSITMDYVNTIDRNISGSIDTDTVWTAAGPGGSNAPYIIQDNLVVSSLSRLIIQPGTVLQFASGSELQIDGSLIVQGSQTAPVIFTANSTSPGQEWTGIRITNIATSAIIDWAIVEYSLNGIQFENSQTAGNVTNTVVVPGISITGSSASETDPFAAVTVSLSATATDVVSVNYATVADSATEGLDYTVTTGTLTFNPGDTSLSIHVPLLQDNLQESTEQFSVNLSSPANATLKSINTASVQIIDVPPVPSLSITSTLASEADAFATFNVVLSFPALQVTTVNYT